MKLTVTIEIQEAGKRFQIQMDSRQRIQTTLRVLAEANKDLEPYVDCVEVRIKSSGKRVQTADTYGEAGIHTGDTVLLGDMTTEGEMAEEQREIAECENIEVERRKKSELTASDYFDYERLVYGNRYFIPCSYVEEGEYINFTYQCTGLAPLTELKKQDKIFQYQFLVNFTRLYDLFRQFSIRALPENLYYDENFLPCVRERDLYPEGKSMSQQEFLDICFSLVGGILGKKYEVQQLQESGIDVLKAEKAFAPYLQAETPEELAEILRNRKGEYIKLHKEQMVEVSKQVNMVQKIVSIGAPIILAGCIAALIYQGLCVIPQQKCVIAAQEAYVEKDYVACIDSMQNILLEDMDIGTKYVLAVSYARSESLEKKEIEALVSKLSVLTKEKELEYWIELGRLEFANAENLAQSLSDDKLLIYAYMKERSVLETDTTVNGEEKESRMEKLKQKIEEIGSMYTTEEIDEEVNTKEESKEKDTNKNGSNKK